ncbi:MAG: serine/threonine-protein phosphatase [Betaproteobacteria bacterium]|nr:serine/threonine-protein phosphatase [Betaproteobacteria bacterium]
MRFAIFQDSRIGARSYQQDRLGNWQTEEALLMVVADGMGGHPRGDVAAQVAVRHLAGAFQRAAQPRLADPQAFLVDAIAGAHRGIHQQARALGLPDIPRTTIVACVIQDAQAYWSHVGDSRLYHIRHGTIQARTRDHTRVQALVDSGRIREEAVGSHPDRSKLLQCLGSFSPPKLEPAVGVRLAKGDVILLCSDGFWGPLTPRQLLTALISKPLDAALAALMSLAEASAGKQCDNLSVIGFA